MEQLKGGLKDIFSTILATETKTGNATPHIVIHGNGNVIAPGGTVHVVHSATRRRAPRRAAGTPS